MVERVKQIPARLLEFWNKYTSKQKTIIICVIAAIVLAIAILSFFLTRTSYQYLISFEDTKSTNELVELLEEKNIKNKVSDDGKKIYVDKKRSTDAILLMGSEDIPKSDMDWDSALDNSISTTEGEKKKKFTLAFQSDIRSYLMTINGVKNASVVINAPEDDGTIFTETKESSVGVVLELTDELSQDAVKGMANYLATSVGNATTDNITIIDTDSNLLFGGDMDSASGIVSSAADYKEKITAKIKNDVRQLLLQANYNDVEIGASNIKFNMDEVQELYTEFSVPEGMEQGPYSSSYDYETNANTSSGGVPGTDSNADDTDYMIQESGGTDSKTTLKKFEYNPNKKETTTVKEVGAVEPNESSIAIVLKRYKYYDEAQLKKDGTLAGMTFDEFIAANDVTTELAVEDSVIELVARTTGISANNITVVAYEKPIFNAEITKATPISNYLMIILAVLIVALLIFVVFKGTAPMEITELEPELSVEQLLATTKENQSLEDIEFGEKSETRKMIEKFVDENPEAVAQLLRNWINEDWG